MNHTIACKNVSINYFCKSILIISDKEITLFFVLKSE